MADSTEQDCLQSDGCYVALTQNTLDVGATLDGVRSRKAGANVLFTGSTRDNFEGRPVATLCYSAYRPLALRSMLDIATGVRQRRGLLSVSIVHRLGPVPIGQDSILVAVSAPHRQAAWRAAEECLDLVKARVEVWKEEVFAPLDASGSSGPGPPERVWRANCESAAAATRPRPGEVSEQTAREAVQSPAATSAIAPQQQQQQQQP